MAVCFKLPSKVAEFGQQAGIDGMAILRQ